MHIRTKTNNSIISYYYDQYVYDTWRHSMETEFEFIRFEDIPRQEMAEFLKDLFKDIHRLTNGLDISEMGNERRIKLLEIQQLVKQKFFSDEREQDED